MANLSKLALLGRPIRIRLGGRMMTAILTDYDESSDSYNGIAWSVGKSIDVSDSQPIQRLFKGAHKYPYTNPNDSRQNRDFQFVFPGEDESGLDDIAQDKVDEAKENLDTVGSGGNSPTEPIDWNKVPPATEAFDPNRDYDGDGQVGTDRDRKKWKKEQKEKEQNR